MSGIPAHRGRHLTVPELSEFLGQLTEAGVSEIGPADVHVRGEGRAGELCAIRLRADLLPFGMRIVLVPTSESDVQIVSSHRPGPPLWWATGDVDHFIEDLRLERLALWAGAASRSIRMRRIHQPGSDSVGVVEFDCDAGRLVAKIGPEDVMRTEDEHVRRAHEAGAPIFPAPRGYQLSDGLATRLMDAVDDAHLVERIFEVGPDGLLHASPTSVPLLDGHLVVLTGWHSATISYGEPSVARYLYVERFETLPRSAACRTVGGAAIGVQSYQSAFAREVVLPDGVATTYEELVGWLARTYSEWRPTHTTAVHGDIFTSNLMYGASGDPRFIDPRSAWDGVATAPEGRGDPMFDLGTLLHAIAPMVAILDASGRGEPWRLPTHDLAGTGPIDARNGLIVDDPARRVYLDRVAQLTSQWSDAGALVRLHIASACSLLGWLKYDKVVRTPEVWWAVFLGVIADLARARRVHEGHDPNFRNDAENGGIR